MKNSCSFGLFGHADRAVRSLVPSYPVCIVSWIWNLILIDKISGSLFHD